MFGWLKWAGIGRRLWLLLLFPAGALLSAFAGHRPDFAEWYAAGPYSALSLAVNRATGLVPFSIGELLVYALCAFLLFRIVSLAVGLIRGKGTRAARAVRFAANLAVFASAAYFLFVVDCGINYSRLPFAETCGLTVRPSSTAELQELCASLAGDLNRLRPGLATDGRDVMKLRQGDLRAVAREAARNYDKISGDDPLLRQGYGEPKPVLLSRLMSRCDITGMFFPFTFEANVNTDVPEYTIPATMCHELTHLRGYMREDEANFVGYLVCRKSGDPDFQYSGDMLAFTFASNALFSADAEAANRIFAGLGDGVRRDLAFNSAYWKQFEGPVAQVSDRVNDRYLKANNQDDGIRSYGRMVDLLLADQRAKKQGSPAP